MLAATFVAILFVPFFFKLIMRWRREKPVTETVAAQVRSAE
jgi:predicted permease